MEPAPVVLEGQLVRLEPLTPDHVDPLAEIGLDPRIWRWSAHPVASREDMRRYVISALDWQKAGTAVPFVTVGRSSGQIVGSTRFGNLDPPNLRAEIGWTWLAPAWWRTGINTEAKLLMLRHAFEAWGCRRVEFKTDSLNEISRRAIARLGAEFEGILRNHMTTAGGRMRHSAYYSILDEEWPGVERRLLELLAGGTEPRSEGRPR
jgi:RimJ/RimL family protein N-acetyltransferase